MIDYGMVVSAIIALGIPALAATWWLISGRDGQVGFIDAAVGPALAGLVVGRLTTLAFDDPGSIGSVSDMIIIRSGVEFWPGVAVAAAAVLLSAHLGLVSPARRISQLAPLAMIGYSGYESACIFRDGCFGPASPIGFRPPGLLTTMLPIGWIMAAAIFGAAFGVHKLVSINSSPVLIVALSVGVVAVVRSVGSYWLPHVGEGLTRQHLTSGLVAAISIVAVVVLVSTPLVNRSGGLEFSDAATGDPKS